MKCADDINGREMLSEAGIRSVDERNAALLQDQLGRIGDADNSEIDFNTVREKKHMI